MGMRFRGDKIERDMKNIICILIYFSNVCSLKKSGIFVKLHKLYMVHSM
jgi:hypothetical protein